MRSNKEYHLSKQIATYLRHHYPAVLFHFEITGSNLSKAQSGKLKAIQGGRGFPDLQILNANPKWRGIFFELKKESPYLKDEVTLKADEHIQEQAEYHKKLRNAGHEVHFVWDFDKAKYLLDKYLNDYNDEHPF